jgi:TM2 domain-containing membrane protein YozV
MQTPNDINAAQQMMRYDANKKTALIAYLLWFFAGYLGAHRFYLGRTISGLIMLVLFLLSCVGMLILVGFIGLAVIGLWWLIDGFLIPGMISAANNKLINSLR